MKKFFLFLLLALISINLVNANIYEFMDFIKDNPGQITIAVDDSAGAAIVAATSELAGKFGITKSILISELTNQQNVIIIQLSSEEKAVIRKGNRGISVLGNEAALIEAVDYIKDFEKHKKALSVDDFWFKEKSNVLPIIIGVVIFLIAGIVAWFLWKKKKPKQLPQKPMQYQRPIQQYQQQQYQQYPQQQFQQSNEKIISIIFLFLIAIGILFITQASITGYASLYFNQGEEHNIYNLIKNILADNSNITVVIDRGAETNEIDAASELTGFFGIIDSRFDDEMSLAGNQILIGKDNALVKQLINWNYASGEAIIEVIEQNNNIFLIVAGTNSVDMQQAVDIIEDYQDNANELKKNCVKIKNYVISGCEEATPAYQEGSTGGGGSDGGDGVGEIILPEEIVEEECIEDWHCSDWSECSPEGMQTRTCEDLNNCGTEQSKPETVMMCEYIPPVEEKPAIVEEAKEEKEIKISFLMPLIFIVLICIITIFFIYKKRFPKKEELPQKIMVPLALVDYIKRSLDSGFDENTIRDALLNRGWKKEMVDRGFEILRNKKIYI